MKAKTKIVTLRIPENVSKALDAHVASIGASKNSFVLMLIAKELQGVKPKRGPAA